MTRTRRTTSPLDKLVKRYATREKNLTDKRVRIVAAQEGEIAVIDRELADIKEILSRLVPAALKAGNKP